MPRLPRAASSRSHGHTEILLRHAGAFTCICSLEKIVRAPEGHPFFPVFSWLSL